jgi:hypothetical protein
MHPHSEFVIIFPQRWIGLHSSRTAPLSAELPSPHPLLLASSSTSAAPVLGVDQQLQQIWCFELYQSGVWWRVSISLHNRCVSGEAMPGPVRASQAAVKGLEGVISVERWRTAPPASASASAADAAAASEEAGRRVVWSYPLTSIAWRNASAAAADVLQELQADVQDSEGSSGAAAEGAGSQGSVLMRALAPTPSASGRIESHTYQLSVQLPAGE